LNYCMIPKEEQCEGNQDLIGKLTPIMKEHLKSISEVVREYPKIYGKGVNKMFLEYLEQEIKLLDNGISWEVLDKTEEKNVFKVQQEIKKENKEEEFNNFFYRVCKNIMDLDDKPKHSNKKVMPKESYINYRK
jgi:hypothetical protein